VTIYDCFIFYNELDILKIRLEELYPVIDKFVLVESNLTFRGKTKPYVFGENKAKFSKYLDKILYVPLNDNNEYSSDFRIAPWEREKWQRNQIALGIQDLQPDDIIIVSDVDEIPRRSTIAKINPIVSVTLGMNMYYYALNMYDGNAWGGAKAVRKKYYRDAESLRHSDPEESISNAGWHFSYLGDAEHIKNKIQSFAHWELDTPEITDIDKMNSRIDAGVDIWGHGKRYQQVEIDDTYPIEVVKNKQYYSKYIR